MGISMGSSEGGGYANADGNLMGWINELCYIKLDMNPEAPTDPWTKGAHRGCGWLGKGVGMGSGFRMSLGSGTTAA